MGRIKLFAMGVRRPDMASEDFHDYWRHPHGTWGQRMSTLRGYVQSHQVHTDLLGPDQSRYECVAEIWLDNKRDLEEFKQEPVFVRYLKDDGINFCQPDKAIYCGAEEEVLTSGPSPNARLNPGDDMWSLDSRPFSTKLMIFFAPNADTTWACGKDEALGASLRALRHVRCHIIDSYRTQAPFLGVQELWWPTLRDFRAGVSAAPGAFRELLSRPGRSVTLVAQAERFL